MLCVKTNRNWLALLVVVAATIIAGVASAAEPISPEAYDRCRAILDDQARLHCFEGLTSPSPEPPGGALPAPIGPLEAPDAPQIPGLAAPAGPPSQSIAGKWRLVRTPNPAEGRELVSIMATAELAGSDIDFAGVNLRCAAPDFDVLVFLISPLPPRAQPAVMISGKAFQGTVVLPGTAILLPKEATVIAKEQWRSLPSLSIDVEAEGKKTHGTVSLEGFDKALQTLATACLSR
jgi:hypothetical protein